MSKNLSYIMPKLDLLDKQYEQNEVTSEESHRKQMILRKVFEENNVSIKDIKVEHGPAFSIFEVFPSPGIKVSKIKALSDDFEWALRVPVRISTGNGYVGIEVPNDKRSVVPMKEMLDSNSFRDSSAALPLAIGLTAHNTVRVIDLTNAPHILMAGASKQGKTNCLQAMVASLLFSKRPDELKLVFIDPKGIECRVYDKLINHYLAIRPDIANEGEECPGAVVTKIPEAAKVLDSLCKEMEERYEKLRMAKTSDIKEYNDRFRECKLNPDEGHKYLPYIVTFVDEYADLALSIGAGPEGRATSRSITKSIIRLALKGRAVGLHMILSTQRPSVGGINGLIKHNFLTRIAFRVASRTDSWTILDASGAEKLIGSGDMLLSTGGEMERIQCAHISPGEIEKVIAYVGGQERVGRPFYLPSSDKKEGSESGGIGETGPLDARFEEAARLVVMSQRGSASDLQRRLGLGFAKAGRIMYQLEKAGIVGPQNGSKPRQVLVGDLDTLQRILDKLEE